GHADEQILEAIAMVGLTAFLDVVQAGLGPAPDFPPRHLFTPEPLPEASMAPSGVAGRETGPAADDPDADLVARLNADDMSALEDLVRRHPRRIYRTLLGITGNVQDAEDCAQNAFIKVFDHIGEFRGASRLGTWVTRIAINEGLQRVRRQRPIESL